MAGLREEEIRAIAPDPASWRAASQLARPAPWVDTAHDDRAAWGSCRGSARVPYSVVVDTHGPASRCSCPSRKLPCKHALGLLLLWARHPESVSEGDPPGDAGAWLAARTARGEPRTVAGADGADGAVGADQDGSGGAEDKSKRAVDPEAAAARVAKRTERIVAGMAELDLWLHDLVRTGLGRVQAQPYGFWDQMAARMVDAQAPAVAATIRRLPGLVRRGGDWPEELLAQLARLHLLASGWAHLSDLTEMQRADLRTAVGWPWPSDQVLAGAREKDRWYVLARSETEEERVTAIRTWLWGLEHGRLALVLDFARPGAAPAWELWPGNVVDAEVARFPGQAALRVLVAERHRDPQHGATPPAWPDLTAVASARSEVVAADPWTDRWPVSVTGVVPSRRGGAWELSDRDGKTLPMSVDDARGWKLLACSGGGGVHLLGEWIGRRVAPLGVWSDGRMVIL